MTDLTKRLQQYGKHSVKERVMSSSNLTRNQEQRKTFPLYQLSNKQKKEGSPKHAPQIGAFDFYLKNVIAKIKNTPLWGVFFIKSLYVL